MSFRGLEVASIQRSRKHRPVCALLAMVFGFGCSTPKSSSVAVPGPAKAEPAKVGAVAPIDVVETTRAAPPAGVLQKSLDEDAPYQELERLIGQAREPVWVTVGDTGVLLTPNLPEFWPKEPVVSADHQIGVLALFFEADGSVLGRTYGINAKG